MTIDEIKLQLLKAQYDLACEKMHLAINDANELKSEIFRLESLMEADNYAKN